MDVKEIIAKVKSSKEYIEYIKYHENNIFSITKVSRWELMHTNFIAWLLNPSESHGLGLYPILQLMQMLCNLKVERYPDDHKIDIFCENTNIQSVEIFREYPVPAVNKNGKQTQKKIDLLLKVKYNNGTLPIVIENKVSSHENGEYGDQTIVYYNWGENNLKHEFKPLYLCLVPLYNKIKLKSLEFEIIDYQKLVYNVIEPCLWRTNNVWTHDTIDTYLKCLSYQTDNEKGHNTMAISTEERKILTDFLTNNSNFIDSLLDIVSEDATDAEKKAIENVRKTTKSFSTKDFSIFEFAGNEYNKTHLAAAIIKKAIEDEKITDYNKLEETFKVIKYFDDSNKSRTKKDIVKKESEITDKKRFDYDDDFYLSGVKFAVRNQWDKPQIDAFIKKVEEEFGYSCTTKGR